MILFMTFIRQPDITRLIDDGQYLNFKNLFRILFNFKTFLLLNSIMKGLFMRFFFFILPVLIIIGCNQKPEYDVIIRNGTIYDGSGEKPYIGDIAINGDTIAAVGDLSSANGTTEIEASGMAVSPGFINMLSWANVSLIHDGKSQSDIRQGVTLEVMGEGWSMGPLNDKMKEECAYYYETIFGSGKFDKALKMLKEDSSTKKAIITINEAPKPKNGKIPCMTCLWARIINGKLTLSCHMRANNAYRIMLMNIQINQAIQKEFAKRLNLPLGNYYHFVDSLHLYKKELNDVKSFLESFRE